jgi:hypothetical protein
VFIKSLPSEGVRRKMKAEVSFLPLGLWEGCLPERSVSVGSEMKGPGKRPPQYRF